MGTDSWCSLGRRRDISRLSRRRLVGGTGIGVLSLAGAGAFSRSMLGTNLSVAATPTADSLGSATPIAQATPVATPRPAPPLQIILDQEPAYDSTPSRGGTLRMMRRPADRTDFNPASFRLDFQVLVSYLDPLLRPDAQTMEPRPWLAESWQVSEDGREITYALRDDVRWHDGTPFTAEDVRFSLLVYRDDSESGVRNMFSALEHVEIVNDHAVRVVLNEPDPGWLLNASSQLIFQQRQYRNLWESRPPGERSLTGFDWQRQLPTGTGPWRIEAIEPDRVAFSRNDEYWEAPPWLDGFLLEWEPDFGRRLAAWRRGDIDLLWPVRSEDIAAVADVPGRLYAAESASIMFAAFNFDNPTGLPRFFDDDRVRCALNLAVDRHRYADDIFRSFIDVGVAGTIVQPWARHPEVENPRHDPNRAASLLGEAGWDDMDGDGVLEGPGGVPFDLTVIVGDDARRELIQVLRSVKEDWAKIGVALRIQILRADEFQERAIRGHDFDLIAYAYDVYPGFTDFDLFGSAWDIRRNRQGWNPGAYQNEAADQAIADLLQQTDPAQQRSALHRLQQAVNDDLFAIWLGSPRDLILGAPDLDGFQPNRVWQTADTRTLWRSEPLQLDESGA